eukprot:COSAG05_NODE_271_length_12468_cov_8.607810_10_plen_141_part_00
MATLGGHQATCVGGPCVVVVISITAPLLCCLALCCLLNPMPVAEFDAASGCALTFDLPHVCIACQTAVCACTSISARKSRKTRSGIKTHKPVTTSAPIHSCVEPRVQCHLTLSLCECATWLIQKRRLMCKLRMVSLHWLR